MRPPGTRQPPGAIHVPRFRKGLGMRADLRVAAARVWRSFAARSAFSSPLLTAGSRSDWAGVSGQARLPARDPASRPMPLLYPQDGPSEERWMENTPMFGTCSSLGPQSPGDACSADVRSRRKIGPVDRCGKCHAGQQDVARSGDAPRRVRSREVPPGRRAVLDLLRYASRVPVSTACLRSRSPRRVDVLSSARRCPRSPRS